MPKVVKKRDASSSSSSDSDSGPDDRTPVKKAKTDASAASSSATDEEGNKYWELDKKKRASVQTYKGKSYVDIREFYEKEPGKPIVPGKKGITLPMSLWLKLLESAEEITKELESK